MTRLDKLKAFALGGAGAFIVWVCLWLAATAYTDHMSLRDVIGFINANSAKIQRLP